MAADRAVAVTAKPANAAAATAHAMTHRCYARRSAHVQPATAKGRMVCVLARMCVMKNSEKAPYCHSTAMVSAHASRRSEEHTSELQSLMRISYAVFCLKKKKISHI